MRRVQFTLMHFPILSGSGRQHLHNCGCDISIKSRYARRRGWSGGETLLAIRSRRYTTTVGPVQSAVCNFGQVVGSPCLPVTVYAHGGLGSTQTMGDATVFARKPRVHAWKHPMDRRARVANPLRQRAFGFKLVHDFSVCFVSSVLFVIHVFTFNVAIELWTYSCNANIVIRVSLKRI